MELGCGLATKFVHGRRYLYIWRYDRSNGRSEKVERYVGRVGSTQTGERAVRMLLEHAMDAKAKVDLRIARYKNALRKMERNLRWRWAGVRPAPSSVYLLRDNNRTGAVKTTRRPP
jgi:hypothetical protein